MGVIERKSNVFADIVLYYYLENLKLTNFVLHGALEHPNVFEINYY